MPRYVSLHTLACLTRQGAQELAAKLAAATRVTATRVLVNTMEGKMLIEFEAKDRETLDAWLAAENFHADWVWRVELHALNGRLEST